MKIAIVGAGLIGVTAAHFLRRHGHEITVIDRREGPGLEASYANGALLCPSMPEPWNTPGCWRVLAHSLGRADSPLQLRLKALPSLASWGVAFLRNSKPAAYERNALSNVRLALHSLTVLKSLRRELRIDYTGAASGALKIFRSSIALDRALAGANGLRAEGLVFRRVSRQELICLEPALAPIARELAGAIYYEADEVGDAYRFCLGLADGARRNGVEFCFGTTVSEFEVRSNTVRAIRTSRGRLTADQYVLAAGSYSPLLTRSLGIRLPVKPAKGYSVTFDPPQRGSALKTPLVDDDLHAVVVPLGGAVRVAGTAEFAGFDLRLRPERIHNLIDLAERLLPQAGLNSSMAKPWCGLRPMSPDGVPIIGPTPLPNLWASTGHGHLGWTMAAGSAEMLADMMRGAAPAIDPAPYTPARFQRK
jgi:D-amino-acid dehydrogenase